MGVVFTAKVSSAVGALAASSAAAHDFKVGARDIGNPRSRPAANGVTVYGIAPIRLGTNITARKDSTQSSNFDHHSCGDLVMAEEGIVGYRGAPGVVLAHNLLNLEFSKYRQRKARGGSATAER